jgi:hypothetical protein
MILILALEACDFKRTIAISYVMVWAFLVVRLHLHVLWLGGFAGFCHLCRRFPTVWINTMVFFPLFFACKVVQWLVCEVLFLDPVGQIYKCCGANLTFKRYARMTRDLEKPLIFRKSGFYWNFTVYPHMLSTQLACNIYTLGPYTGFGILTMLFDQNHVVFRNGMFGTHPCYNYHVTVFFDNDKGEAYWHTAHACLPIFEHVYRRLWEFYSEHMIDVIIESEQRLGDRITAPCTDLDATWIPTNQTLFFRQARVEKTHLIVPNEMRQPSKYTPSQHTAPLAVPLATEVLPFGRHGE